MKNTSMAGEELVEALRLTIGESSGPERAAVDLLAASGGWLERLTRAGRVQIIHDPETPETGARIHWDQLTQDLASGAQVDLRAELARVSGHAAADVADAVVCATRSHNSVLVTRSPGGLR